MKEKSTHTKHVPLIARVLSPVAKYFYQCTEECQQNIKNLAGSLLFTVVLCGAVLAASICQFCLHGDYTLSPLIFALCAAFYYLLDKPIVFSDVRPHSATVRKIRIGIAIVLGLFNSMLIDSFYFAPDIQAERIQELKVKETDLRIAFAKEDSILNVQRTAILSEIGMINTFLTAKRDSLNAEADGTGGSGKVGRSDIWHTKYRMYQADSLAAAQQIVMLQEQIEKIDSSAALNSLQLQREIYQLPEAQSQGINKSMTLLHEIIWIKGDFTNIFMSVLLLLITMMAELVPLISKGYYDVSEYFEKSANQREVKEKEATLEKNKEINLTGHKIVLDQRREQINLKRDDQIAYMEACVEHNKMVNSINVVELDRLRVIDEQLKKKHPDYYERYVRPMMLQCYINLHNVTMTAINQ